jgi:hypothetical protein
MLLLEKIYGDYANIGKLYTGFNDEAGSFKDLLRKLNTFFTCITVLIPEKSDDNVFRVCID